jgi:hypothetical protein
MTDDDRVALSWAEDLAKGALRACIDRRVTGVEPLTSEQREAVREFSRTGIAMLGLFGELHPDDVATALQRFA